MIQRRRRSGADAAATAPPPDGWRGDKLHFFPDFAVDGWSAALSRKRCSTVGNIERALTHRGLVCTFTLLIISPQVLAPFWASTWTGCAASILIILFCWKRGFARTVPSRERGFAISGAADKHEERCPQPTLRVLTYNLFLRPPGTPGSAHGYGSEEFKDERLETFFEMLDSEAGEVDVLCLQEVFAFGSFRREALLERAFRHGYCYYMCPPPPPLLDPIKLVDAGLLIVSKHPIVAGHHHRYGGAAAKGDIVAAKGAIHAEVHIQGRAVHVFTTHLQASTLGSETADEIGIRLSQLDELGEFVETVRAESNCDHPAVIAGDFNCDAHHDRDKSVKLRLDQSAPVSREYVGMMRTLHKRLPRLTDCLLHGLLVHPITCGDVKEQRQPDGSLRLLPMDTELAMQEEQCGQSCLDYIFFVPKKDDPIFSPPSSPHPGGNGTRKEGGPSRIDVAVCPFHAPDQPFKQCSDHYGVVASLPL